MNTNVPSFMVAIVCLLLITAGSAQDMKPERPSETAAPASGEEIKWQVIAAGGTDGGSTVYMLGGTAGQVAVGVGGSANFGLSNGFWQEFGSVSCCVGMTGNVDNDGGHIVDIGDLTALISYLFIPPNPVPVCMEEANVDGDVTKIVDIGDLTALIAYLFIPPNPVPEDCQ